MCRDLYLLLAQAQRAMRVRLIEATDLGPRPRIECPLAELAVALFILFP